MSKFSNTDPTQPWNDPAYRDDPNAPWNDMSRENDPFEPWNDRCGTERDLSEQDRRRYRSY